MLRFAEVRVPDDLELFAVDELCVASLCVLCSLHAYLLRRENRLWCKTELKILQLFTAGSMIRGSFFVFHFSWVDCKNIIAEMCFTLCVDLIQVVFTVMRRPH